MLIQDAVGDDEEKASMQDLTLFAGLDALDKTQTEKALAAQPKMCDVFSWQNMEYTVTLSHGEQRRLLDDISGYVVPGKLTALMGESGAGKVSTDPIMAYDIFLIGVADHTPERPGGAHKHWRRARQPICQRTSVTYGLSSPDRVRPAAGHAPGNKYSQGGVAFLCQATSAEFSPTGRERSLVCEMVSIMI